MTANASQRVTVRYTGVALIALATVLLVVGLFLLAVSWLTAAIVLSWAVVAALAGGGVIYATSRRSSV